MAQVHLYILFEESQTATWTAQQRQTIFNTLRGLGKQADAQPCKINHTRRALNNRKVLIEAEFDSSEVTKVYVGTQIANALGVSLAAVDAGIDLTVFGGINATREQSLAAWMAYFTANKALWESATI